MLSISDAKIVAAVESKDVAIVEKTVGVTAPDGKKVNVPFRGLTALTAKGCAIIMDGKIDTKDENGAIERQTLVGAFNYAVDLFERANERGKALAKFIDPLKAQNAAVAKMVAAGVPEDEAIAFFVARQAKLAEQTEQEAN